MHSQQKNSKIIYDGNPKTPRMPKRVKKVTRKTKAKSRTPRRSKRLVCRMFSPSRHYGGKDSAYKRIKQFYDDYISPAVGYISPKTLAAYQYMKDQIRQHSPTLKGTARKARKAARWTYKNLLVRPASFTGKVVPPVARFIRDYGVYPTYRGVRDISPVIGRSVRDYVLKPAYEGTKVAVPGVGRFTRDYVLKPTYEGAKVAIPAMGRFTRDYVLKPTYEGTKVAVPGTARFTRDYVLKPIYRGAKDSSTATGRAALEYAVKPIGRASARQAKKFHEYMMSEEEAEDDYDGNASATADDDGN